MHQEVEKNIRNSTEKPLNVMNVHKFNCSPSIRNFRAIVNQNYKPGMPPFYSDTSCTKTPHGENNICQDVISTQHAENHPGMDIHLCNPSNFRLILTRQVKLV